jgi:anti-sigma regulatory factor (Ser/Thr protein kinase)
MTRTGVAAGHRGYFHEALQYSSDDELLDVVVPFLTGGAEAGEPTVVSLGDRNGALVRSALPPGADVTFVGGDGLYARPAAAIRSYCRMLAGYTAAGATQIRIIGEVPTAALGGTWDWWARYEAAINHAYDEFPLWSMCAYDTRITPEPVLADVARTHPRSALPGGRHVRNMTYTDPVAYLSEPRPAPVDPLLCDAPAAELVDPSPAAARQVIRRIGAGPLTGHDIEDLAVAVTEAVSNAIQYGKAPCRVRIWSGPDRVVAEISDSGTGLSDPFAGLLPVNDTALGGRGLWMAHQFCNHVVAYRTADGFTIRLTGGNPDF